MISSMFSQSGQQEGTMKPLLWRFSEVRILLGGNNLKKKFTLGVALVFYILFQIEDLGKILTFKIIWEQPSLTDNELFHPHLSSIDCRKGVHKIIFLIIISCNGINFFGIFSIFHPIQRPCRYKHEIWSKWSTTPCIK